jgi:hypothetical protein
MIEESRYVVYTTKGEIGGPKRIRRILQPSTKDPATGPSGARYNVHEERSPKEWFVSVYT